MTERRDLKDWLLEGATNGWCSMVVCASHDGIPMTPEEVTEFDEGYDPCIPAVRIWAVEDDLETGFPLAEPPL